MKMITPMVLGIIATLTLSRLSVASQNSIDTVLAAEAFLVVARDVQALVESRPALSGAVWDSQRLSQAAERFPGIVGAGVDFFTVERKFSRISQLTLSLREKLIDSFGEECESDVADEVVVGGDGSAGPSEDVLKLAIERLETAYLDLASALYDTAPEPDITAGKVLRMK